MLKVRVSAATLNKTEQLRKHIEFSKANRVWGKDQKFLKSNLLIVPTAKNYTVLLALGKRSWPRLANAS